MAERQTPTAGRTVPVLLALVLALGWAPPVSAQAQESQTTAPGEKSGDGAGGSGRTADTRTWSVRPTPDEARPERPNFSYDVEGGATLEDSIRVRNFGDEALPLAIYASDAITTSSGALDLLPAGEKPTDVGAWIEMAVDRIEVLPGEAVDVPFTMTMPANAEPGDHTGGIVTSFQSVGQDDAGESVVLDRRLGSRVRVRVGGVLQPSLEIRDVTVDYAGTFSPVGTGTATVSWMVVNTGNVRLAAGQRIVVPGRLVVPGRTRDVEDVPEVLPDNSLSFTAEVPAVWPTFRTTATVEVTPMATRGGDAFEVDPIAASGTASSIPWGQLAVLLALVALVVWSAWSRRRRRRREDAIRAEARAETQQGQGTSAATSADAPEPRSNG